MMLKQKHHVWYAYLVLFVGLPTEYWYRCILIFFYSFTGCHRNRVCGRPSLWGEWSVLLRYNLDGKAIGNTWAGSNRGLRRLYPTVRHKCHNHSATDALILSLFMVIKYVFVLYCMLFNFILLEGKEKYELNCFRFSLGIVLGF